MLLRASQNWPHKIEMRTRRRLSFVGAASRNHAADRRPSSRRSQWTSWFELAQSLTSVPRERGYRRYGRGRCSRRDRRLDRIADVRLTSAGAVPPSTRTSGGNLLLGERRFLPRASPLGDRKVTSALLLRLLSFSARTLVESNTSRTAQASRAIQGMRS
jgi:hypothetical protein